MGPGQGLAGPGPGPPDRYSGHSGRGTPRHGGGSVERRHVAGRKGRAKGKREGGVIALLFQLLGDSM